MEVVWSDMVNADKELGSFQQWDPSNKDMRQTMEAFLIDIMCKFLLVAHPDIA